MILFVRKRYNLLPTPDLGWLRGMQVEMNLLRVRVPPIEMWHQKSRELWNEFFIAPEADEDLGGFALPTPGAGAGAGQALGLESGGTARITHNPERLLFYMAHPKYREIRSLDKKNPYGYCVVVFDGEKVIIDTATVGNRLFGLQGPIGECLELAKKRKGEIRSSPLCKLPVVHGAGGGWKDRVTSWLSQD